VYFEKKIIKSISSLLTVRTRQAAEAIHVVAHRVQLCLTDRKQY